MDDENIWKSQVGGGGDDGDFGGSDGDFGGGDFGVVMIVVIMLRG